MGLASLDHQVGVRMGATQEHHTLLACRLAEHMVMRQTAPRLTFQHSCLTLATAAAVTVIVHVQAGTQRALQQGLAFLHGEAMTTGLHGNMRRHAAPAMKSSPGSRIIATSNPMCLSS